MSIDLFACIKSFVAVAEASGFSEAARKLRISTPVLTKQVQKLEKELGKKLFDRTTRFVSLTEAGEIYLKNSRKILEDVELAHAEVNNIEKEPHGQITIGIPGIFNSASYMKALKSFMKKYPKIILYTSADNSPHRILDGKADLVISEMNFNDSQLIKEKFTSIKRGLFASPQYLKEKGTPQKIIDLKDHECILYKRVSPEDLWIFPNNKKVKVSGSFVSDSGVNCILAAVADIGILWCAHMVIEEEISRKKLVEIKLDSKPFISDAFLYHRPTPTGSNVKLLIEHLKVVGAQQ